MNLQQFILRHVESVEHLRALLLLRTEPKREWGAAEVSARLYLQPKQAAALLASLRGAGLLTETEGGGYRFEPQTPELARMVEEVAMLDRERPVTLIKLIYSRPDTLEAFAEAFRIRKDPDKES